MLGDGKLERSYLKLDETLRAYLDGGEKEGEWRERSEERRVGKEC